MRNDLIAIVAWDKNRAIGSKNDLPWPRIRDDMKHFQSTTAGHTVVMGRKTADSIGKPLPNRRNIVLSKKKEDINHPGFQYVHSVEILAENIRNDEKVFVIGGAQIYELLLPYVQKLIVTSVLGTYEADTYFPNFIRNEWQIESQEYRRCEPVPVMFFEFTRTNKPSSTNVSVNNAGAGEYRELIARIAQSDSGCGFCPDNFPECHKQPILAEIGKWQVTRNSWPYANSRDHFILIYEDHTDDPRTLSSQDWADYGAAISWLVDNFNLPGGGQAMRFLDPKFSGASVNGHLHGIVAVPDIGRNTGPNPPRPIKDKEFQEHPDAVWIRIG